ncbi:hypothetical protein AB0N17_03105 [Streptomyces sp. NPDC051133]|uniref:hypothetical protein n=1 Tax=Streptomyces sp. NPDC051133 TaxID=3155521 RepID=UPI0034382A18
MNQQPTPDTTRVPLWGQDALRIRDALRQLLAPTPAVEPWPDGVIARYVTKAADLTGDVELTVDVTKIDGGFRRHCRGCGDSFENFWEPAVRDSAQIHAERCRALPKPEATR